MKDNHKADVSHTDEFDRMYQEMVKQAEDKYKIKFEHPKTEEEIGLVDNLSSRWVNEFELPNGYIFKDENDNVINATKIVLEKKKKEYPKTYEECLSVLEIYNGLPDVEIYNAKPSECELFEAFIRLKRCRDAYWKIAGEEMGLGEPWKPNWENGNQKKYCIYNDMNIIKTGICYFGNDILAFPTKKIRDNFYENFRKLIEQCEELL